VSRVCYTWPIDPRFKHIRFQSWDSFLIPWIVVGEFARDLGSQHLGQIIQSWHIEINTFGYGLWFYWHSSRIRQQFTSRADVSTVCSLLFSSVISRKILMNFNKNSQYSTENVKSLSVK